MDEVNTLKTQSGESAAPKQADRRQKFQRRDQQSQSAQANPGSSGPQFFKRSQEDATQKAAREQQQEEDDKSDDEKLTFEDFREISNYQIQNEIFELIKNKIGTSDKEKIQKFYSTLH